MGVLSLKGAVIIAVLGLFAMPTVSNAESIANLTKNGFSVSKITKGRSGRLGWNVTKGDKTYFCPAFIAAVYIDKNRMYHFTSSGSPIETDRKTYDDYIGGPDPNIPYWKDIQAGRVKPADVAPCVPAQ